MFYTRTVRRSAHPLTGGVAQPPRTTGPLHFDGTADLAKTTSNLRETLASDSRELAKTSADHTITQKTNEALLAGGHNLSPLERGHYRKFTEAFRRPLCPLISSLHTTGTTPSADDRGHCVGSSRWRQHQSFTPTEDRNENPLKYSRGHSAGKRLCLHAPTGRVWRSFFSTSSRSARIVSLQSRRLRPTRLPLTAQ